MKAMSLLFALILVAGCETSGSGDSDGPSGGSSAESQRPADGSDERPSPMVQDDTDVAGGATASAPTAGLPSGGADGVSTPDATPTVDEPMMGGGQDLAAGRQELTTGTGDDAGGSAGGQDSASTDAASGGRVAGSSATAGVDDQTDEPTATGGQPNLANDPAAGEPGNDLVGGHQGTASLPGLVAGHDHGGTDSQVAGHTDGHGGNLAQEHAGGQQDAGTSGHEMTSHGTAANDQQGTSAGSDHGHLGGGQVDSQTTAGNLTAGRETSDQPQAGHTSIDTSGDDPLTPPVAGHAMGGEETYAELSESEARQGCIDYCATQQRCLSQPISAAICVDYCDREVQYTTEIGAECIQDNHRYNQCVADEGCDAIANLEDTRCLALLEVASESCNDFDFAGALDPEEDEDAPAEVDIIAALSEFLAQAPRPDIDQFPHALNALSREDADVVTELIWNDYAQWARNTYLDDVVANRVTAEDVQMRYACYIHGEKPAAGWDLYISLHGGGGAPTAVNDEQWLNQQDLYNGTNTLDHALYCAPRAPSDTWNMWFRNPLDALFDRMISNLVIMAEVNPNRVYLMGYSAGGDGLYRLAPRMADRWAAAAMMAGHPGGESPYGLRNIGFALHMGELDSAYNRNGEARRWKSELEALRAAEGPSANAYAHQAVIHADTGHWMDFQDAMAIPFMADFTRNPWPTRIHWHQSGRTHKRFYWLKNHDPQANVRMTAEHVDGQIQLSASAPVTLSLLLNDVLVDLDQPLVVVDAGGNQIYSGTVARTVKTIYETVWARGDKAMAASAELFLGEVTLGQPGQ